MKWSEQFAFVFAAFSFGIACLLILSFISQNKYVCTNMTSDSKITVIQVLESLYIVVAFALMCLYMAEKKTLHKNYEYAKICAVVLFVCSTGILITYLVFQRLVCDDKCLQGQSAQDAIAAGLTNLQEPRVVAFIQQTATMTGTAATGVGYIDSVLTPAWFKTKTNYCKETLNSLNGANDYTNSVSERCLVWGCTKEIVDNMSNEEGLFIFGLIIQCCLSSFIIAHDWDEQPKEVRKASRDRSEAFLENDPEQIDTISIPKPLNKSDIGTINPENISETHTLLKPRRRVHPGYHDNLHKDTLHF